MQAEQMKQRIEKIEQCVDEAKRAVEQGSASPELKQQVMALHDQARQAKQQGGQQMGEEAMRSTVLQLEQSADRAMQACRSAGPSVDAKTQQAVQRAHSELSSLKKEIQMQ